MDEVVESLNAKEEAGEAIDVAEAPLNNDVRSIASAIDRTSSRVVNERDREADDV